MLVLGGLAGVLITERARAIKLINATVPRPSVPIDL